MPYTDLTPPVSREDIQRPASCLFDVDRSTKVLGTQGVPKPGRNDPLARCLAPCQGGRVQYPGRRGRTGRSVRSDRLRRTVPLARRRPERADRQTELDRVGAEAHASAAGRPVPSPEASPGRQGGESAR
jgi:hypothetical protein